MIDGVPVGLAGAFAFLMASGWGVATYFMRQVFNGRWVSRDTYDQALAAVEVANTHIANQDVQIRELYQVGRTVEAIFRAMPTVAADAEPIRPVLPGAEPQETRP